MGRVKSENVIGVLCCYCLETIDPRAIKVHGIACRKAFYADLNNLDARINQVEERIEMNKKVNESKVSSMRDFQSKLLDLIQELNAKYHQLDKNRS